MESDTTGTGVFELRKWGSELDYKLTVANIEDFVAAHVHYEVAGENGPVVVELFDGSTSGRTQSVLAEGTITEDDLVGPLEGATVSDLTEGIRATTRT